MQKVIAIGDTHGRELWKAVIKKHEFDKFIFIGDYFDTHEDVTGRDQINNFKDIIAFKEEFPEKVVLLFGNHDFHYLPGITENYSGYKAEYALEIGELLSSAIKKNLLQMCYIHQGRLPLLFSHAGVTKTWLKSTGYTGEVPLDIFINSLFTYTPKIFCFTPGESMSNTGDDVTQTPIWVRPKSLSQDALPDYVHVVGHTTVPQIEQFKNITLIDCLGTSKEFFEANANGFRFARI